MKRAEVKACAQDFQHTDVLVGLNPIFTVVLLQPHVHNVLPHTIFQEEYLEYEYLCVSTVFRNTSE